MCRKRVFQTVCLVSVTTTRKPLEKAGHSETRAIVKTMVTLGGVERPTSATVATGRIEKPRLAGKAE